MKYASIKKHLKPYSIYKNRKTTINHAFSSSIAPCDEFDDKKIREAVIQLGQNPNEELICVYCGHLAETWDHVFATVFDSEFSGSGHRIGNLVPCCKSCNSKKGSKDWNEYFSVLKIDERAKSLRVNVLSEYLKRYYFKDPVHTGMKEYQALLDIRNKVIGLFKEADVIAEQIRDITKMVNE